jgi:uncharacterized membrane protein
VGRRIYSVPLTGALDDIVWGMLLGHVLYGRDAAMPQPLAAMGVSGQMVDRLRRGLAPGGSVLVVVGEDAQVQQVAAALAPIEPQVRVGLPVEG